jgi:hypothetical protein
MTTTMRIAHGVVVGTDDPAKMAILTYIKSPSSKPFQRHSARLVPPLPGGHSSAVDHPHARSILDFSRSGF